MFEIKNCPLRRHAGVVIAGAGVAGVAAALGAARAGAKVLLLEKSNTPGGMAGPGMIAKWMQGTHSPLQLEIDSRVAQSPLAPPQPANGLLNECIKSVLFEMLAEANVELLLDCRVIDAECSGNRVTAVFAESVGGIERIEAPLFIDATGDGDLAASLDYPMWRNDHLQPPTMCAKYSKIPGAPAENFIWELGKLVHAKKEKYHMPEGNIWGCALPDSTLYMIAGTKIPKLDVADLRNLSIAEIEGRRQIRAMMDIIVESGYPRPTLEALPSLIGIRDTRHINGLYRLTTEDLLSGKPFDDAIAYGTYRLDIHQQQPPGVLFKYLDGKQEFHCPHKGITTTSWRDRSLPTPDCYQIPLRCLIPQHSRNVICAGRMLDADKGAYGATRVMVTMNQTGEAAGVAAYLALTGNCGIADVPARLVRKHLHQW